MTNIAVFDSGLGGVATVKNIIDKRNNYYFVGDIKRVPYGDRQKDEIIKYSKEIVDYLNGFDIDYFIVACNTICVSAIDYLRENYDYKFVSIVDCGLESIKKTDGDVAVLSTKRTYDSHFYKNNVKDRNVYEISSPGLVPIIEDGLRDRDSLNKSLKEYLKIANEKQIPNILLGCTHFPLVKDFIMENLDYKANIIDPSDYLKENIPSTSDIERHKILLTDIMENTQKMVDRIFGKPTKINKIDLK